MVALALRDLTRQFGTTVAVDRMNLEIGAGEFVCLLGPSGCGKSTALRMIAGFETPDGGDNRASWSGVPRGASLGANKRLRSPAARADRGTPRRLPLPWKRQWAFS